MICIFELVNKELEFVCLENSLLKQLCSVLLPYCRTDVWLYQEWYQTKSRGSDSDAARVVVIPCASRVNSSSWRVRRAINPLIFSLKASWLSVWISETCFDISRWKSNCVFFRATVVTHCAFYQYLIPFTVSKFSMFSEIEHSSFKTWIYDESGVILVVYKCQHWSNFHKRCKALNSEIEIDASKTGLNQVISHLWEYVVVLANAS